MKLKNIKKEEGFWSAFVLILLTTLALMGMGAYVLMRSEGINVADEIESLQTDYSATGAVYYSLRALQAGTFSDGASVTIGGVSVTLDTARTQSGNDSLHVMARTSDGTVTEVGAVLEGVAVWTTGNVINVSIFDNNGNQSSNLVARNASSIMVMNLAALLAVPNAQVFTGNTTINNTYSPTGNTNFYQSDGVTPNVTIVNGNLTIGRNGTVYGIVVVRGNLTIQSGGFLWGFSAGRVVGVVYLPDSGNTISMARRTRITGAVLSNGNITGSGSGGIITHNINYVNTFVTFRLNPNVQWASGISSWNYQ